MDADPIPLLFSLLAQSFYVVSTNYLFFYLVLAIFSLIVLFCLELASVLIAKLDENDLQLLEETNPNTFAQLSKSYIESNRLGILFFVARFFMTILVVLSLYFVLAPYRLNFWLIAIIICAVLGVFLYLLPLMFSKFSTSKLQFVMFICHPIVRIAVPIANAFTIKQKLKPTSDLSLSDLETALPTTEEDQAKPSIANLNLYKQVLRFDKIRIRHVMRPKKELEGIKANYNLGEVLHKIKASNHSRLPVYEGNWSKIHGIIHCKDLLPHTEKDQLDWKKLIRPIIYVQERDYAQAVLRKFQQTKNHMALVMSSSKRLVGLVTLEDITEEIIGEIEDE